MKGRSLVAVLAVVATSAGVAAADCGAPPSAAPPVFSAPSLVDPVRAGGEPSIQPLADGSLLYASHAGTTHLYKTGDPTDFAAPYTGTIFVWRSTDGGDSWTPVSLREQTTGLELPEGFSDPSTAVDREGNVYISAIDTATVYVGRSEDGSGFVGNKLAAINMDREWIAADLDGVVYMIATPFGYWPNDDEVLGRRVLWRSSDGGASWKSYRGSALPGGGSMSPLLVNPVDGSLVFVDSQYGSYGPRLVYVFPNAREGDLRTVRRGLVSSGLPNHGGFFNASAADDAGTLYVISNTGRTVRVAISTDRGRTWRTETVAEASGGEIVWPWVAAGADGRVAVVWFEREAGTQRWFVEAATSVTARGWIDACGAAQPGAWTRTRVTPDPFHSGYICDQGLACNARAGTDGDRRLGDYFTAAITPQGQLVIAYGETASDPGSAISHPAFVTQTGGMDFRP